MWLKGDQTRLHPFNAGCIYKTGVVCLDQGKVEAAVYVHLLFPPPFPSLTLILQRSNLSSFVPFFPLSSLVSSSKPLIFFISKHLRDSVEITKFHADTFPVEHARGLFKLSEALTQNSSSNENEEDGSEDEAQNLRDEAEVYLLKRDKDATEFGSEDVYDRWVPIFWR